MAMIKTKFGFFQVQIKSMLRRTIEFCQTSFCETPERFDTVNIAFATGKLIIPVMNLEILIKADIDQSIITTSSYLIVYSKFLFNKISFIISVMWLVKWLYPRITKNM